MGSTIVGKVLQNQFRVDHYIASGGMASVFQVWDIKRNVPLAMKVLQTDLAEDPTILKRFQREARAMQKLVHPNIVPFYGLYREEDFYFLLELFIDGPNLKDIIKQAPDRTLSITDTLIFTKAVSAALGYAHANHVVHCDIKPGNIMVDRGGNIYLADFGIARHADSTTTSMAGAGTAAYMAPEQIMEETVSAQTDIYALAIMVFEMLAGRRPFLGEDFSQDSRDRTLSELLREAHLKVDPPKLSEIRPDLPVALSEVLQKALSKQQKDRYESMQEFFTALCAAVEINPYDIPDRIEIQRLFKIKSSISDSITTEVKTPEIESKTIAYYIKRYSGILIGIIGVFALIIIIPNILNAKAKNQANDTNGDPAATIVSSDILLASTQEKPLATSTKRIVFTPTDSPTKTPTTIPSPTALPFEIKYNNYDGAEMVLIPAGEFEMGAFPGETYAFWGAEQPRHKVYLDEYYIYRTEVTNKMYKKCVAERACPKPEYDSTDKYPKYYSDQFYDNYPVLFVTWTSAVSYCKWARGNLPTEAQWEKAARGTDQRIFPWGDEDPGNNKANFCDVNCPATYAERAYDDSFAETAPVGSFPEGASFYGLVDMGGNAYEWVLDWFGALYYEKSPLRNPEGPASSNTRVVRGGSWYSDIEGVQVTARYYHNPTRAMPYLGFRCAVDPTNYK